MQPLFAGADVPTLLALLVLAVGVLARELYTRRLDKMPRRSADFRREATKIPYDMELEDGRVVVFQDPNRLTTRSAFELAKEQDPEVVLKKLLGSHFDAFWSEFGDRPQDETNAVIEDVMTYYGANPKSLANSASS